METMYNDWLRKFTNLRAVERCFTVQIPIAKHKLLPHEKAKSLARVKPVVERL